MNLIQKITSASSQLASGPRSQRDSQKQTWRITFCAPTNAEMLLLDTALPSHLHTSRKNCPSNSTEHRKERQLRAQHGSSKLPSCVCVWTDSSFLLFPLTNSLHHSPYHHTMWEYHSLLNALSQSDSYTLPTLFYRNAHGGAVSYLGHKDNPGNEVNQVEN